jgi:hypothetical protein
MSIFRFWGRFWWQTLGGAVGAVVGAVVVETPESGVSTNDVGGAVFRGDLAGRLTRRVRFGNRTA